MAGGVGERFWPLSAPDRPKQLLEVFQGRTLLRETFDRAVAIVRDPARVLLVTQARMVAAARNELPELDADQILSEPLGRNTAPAVLYAVHEAAHRHGEDVVLVALPADNLISDMPLFQGCIENAVNAAVNHGVLALVGFVPEYAEPGFGYIVTEPATRQGEGQSANTITSTGTSRGGFPVARFVEKPDRHEAERLVASGRAYWNAGIFVATVRTFRDQYAMYAPDIAESLGPLATLQGRTERNAHVTRCYPSLPVRSIDVAIAEQSHQMWVFPYTGPWHDVGSYESWYQLLLLRQTAPDKDGSKNVWRVSLGAEPVALAAHGNLVVCEGVKNVALLGVEDLVIVDTGDTLLVARRDQAQAVRQVAQHFASGGGRTP